jgi:light-regulated signal transduction histidine kinase (bacteriophytochrome)
MSRLIEDMLVLARISRADLEKDTVNLSNLAESAAERLRSIDKNREAKFKIEREIQATGDPVLLRAALENLLGNAWKYTANTKEPEIEFGTKKINNTETYFVRDNGAGFDMARAEKLFQPFQRLHSASEFEGTGIGLASVKRIITRHGGRVWAEGQVGKGATFYFTLC